MRAWQAPLLHHAKMNEKAPATGTPINRPVDAHVCRRCGSPNHAHALMCVLCGDPLPSPLSAPAIRLYDDEPFPAFVIDPDFDDVINYSNAPIACPNCTLLNMPGSHVCAACLTSLTLFDNPHCGASSSHAPQGRTGAESAHWSDKACFRCMFPNDGLARACVACGNPLEDAGTMDCLVADDLNDEIECKKCTLLNKADAVVCGACSTPLNSYHDQRFMVHDGASNYDGQIDNMQGKVMCRKCTFCNDMSATVCTCCNSELVAEGEVMEEQMIVCQTCKGHFKSKSSGYELMSCHHGFCKPCLWASVAKHLLPLTENDDEDIPDGIDVECPVEGCGRALSREDLRLVAGPGILVLLDEWRMAVLIQKVIDPLIHRCPHCKELMLPSNQLHSLDKKALYRALKIIGISPPSKRSVSKSVLVQQLQCAVPSLLCSSCFLQLCEKCGASLKSDAAHECNSSLKQCFDIARSIMKLCSAYVQAAQSCARKTRTDSVTSKVRNYFSNQERVSSSSVDDKVCASKSIISWFVDKNLDAMFEEEGTNAQGQEIVDKADDDKVDIALRKRTIASIRVDKQAQKALQELTNGILNILKDHQGALPPSVVALLCSHNLPFTLLKWLVGNDSIINITARSQLYWEVLSLMQALSSSWDLLPLICSCKAEYDCWATQCRWETPGSIMSDFGKLFKQAQFMLQRSEHLLMSDGEDKKGKAVLEEDGAVAASLVADVEATFQLLCKRIKLWEEKTSQHQWLTDTISEQHLPAAGHNKGKLIPDNEQRKCKLAYFINQKSSILKGDSSASPHIQKPSSRRAHAKRNKPSHAYDDPKHKHDGPKCECDDAAVPSAALAEAYKKALRPFQFDEVCLLPTHYYRRMVQNVSTNVMLNKKRARAIGEELVQLNTILPLEWESSIFLRIDKQRSDVLRALIIGPKGTPYENGVFLFDLWLQDRYPEKPPLVQFLTTGGGTVRFNPNLYACGKVCLSLLGTWDGPGWKAGESTILQVLVSIQALVLVENPYYNEPGFDHFGNNHEAEVYLHEQRLNTVLHSMLPALRHPDPVFLPVIHTHFRLKAPHILHQCNMWIEQESCCSMKESLVRSFEELRLELNRLTGARLP